MDAIFNSSIERRVSVMPAEAICIEKVDFGRSAITSRISFALSGDGEAPKMSAVAMPLRLANGKACSRYRGVSTSYWVAIVCLGGGNHVWNCSARRQYLSELLTIVGGTMHGNEIV
jgi:hypothetical protein